MIDAAALLELNTLGLTAEQYAGVLQVIASATARGGRNGITDAARAGNARRQKAFRERRRAERNAVTNVMDVTPPSPPSPPSPSPDKEISPAPLLENNLFPLPPLPPAPRVVSPREFADFWTLFPNKVGKADALKAFERAVKRVDLETMMAGLRRYVAKTDDRPWCNPATWLNQDRWNDQPAPRASPQRSASARARGLGGVMENLRQEIEDEQSRTAGAQGGDRQPVGLLPSAGR